MKPIHITMLAPFGIRPKGTLAVRMLPLAQALVRRGHRVRIVAPPVHNPQDAGTQHRYEGVVVEHTPRPRLPGVAGVAQQVAMLLARSMAERADVLHLFKPKGYSGLVALLAQVRTPSLPLVVDTDDWEGWGGWNDLLDYPRPARSVFAWQERDLPRRAAAVTVASRTLQTQVWGFGVPPERVFYLPNGVSQGAARVVPGVEPLKPSDRPTVLLYTRFWEFEVQEIVLILAALRAQCSQVLLLVVGKGERGEEHELLALAERAGLSAAIEYCGWVEPHDLPQLFARARVALAPMDDTLVNRARCSVKLLELMAAGLPIVAGRVGQVAEYIEHEQSGLLVAPGDVTAMARAVLRLLQDGALRARLGQSAHERATRVFAWDRLASTAERAYGFRPDT